MLKDFLAEKGISIYHAAKASGISYSTLNDIANVKSGILHALAGVLQVSMDQLYDICSETIDVYDEEYDYSCYSKLFTLTEKRVFHVGHGISSTPVLLYIAYFSYKNRSGSCT